MKEGSVIIDLAASSGGNCELTKNNDITIHKGVTLIGKSDYYRTMPVDASYMVGHNFLSFLQLILDDAGNLNLNWQDEIINTSCLTRDGEILNKKIKQFYTQYIDK